MTTEEVLRKADAEKGIKTNQKTAANAPNTQNEERRVGEPNYNRIR